MCIRDRNSYFTIRKHLRAFIEEKFHTSDTVSYTHLDVYKRQPNIYAHEATLYAEDEMKLGDKWTFNAGLRYSFYLSLIHI